MAKFNCYLKDTNSKKPTSIILVCLWANKQVKLYTGKTILPEYWNPNDKRARIIKEYPDGRKLNAVLDKLEAEIKTSFWNLELSLNRNPSKAEFLEVGYGIVNPEKVQKLKFNRLQTRSSTRV